MSHVVLFFARHVLLFAAHAANDVACHPLFCPWRASFCPPGGKDVTCHPQLCTWRAPFCTTCGKW